MTFTMFIKSGNGEGRIFAENDDLSLNPLNLQNIMRINLTIMISGL